MLDDDIKNHYSFNKVLGKGSFGSVHRAENLNGNIECAVKTIEKKKLEGH
jgi:serine/threonine protein kinase